MKDDTLSTDPYSITLSRVLDNPGVIKTADSTITTVTMLRNTETWVVRTVRVPAGDYAFVQRIDEGQPVRLVLPPKVMQAIARQRDAIIKMSRKRAARQGVATRAAKAAEKQ